jgi:hypothetical protein
MKLFYGEELNQTRAVQHALSGPFDGLRSTGIPASPALWKGTTTVTSASTVLSTPRGVSLKRFPHYFLQNL